MMRDSFSIRFFVFIESDSILHNLLIEQITHLNISISNDTRSKNVNTFSRIFVLILSSCQRLMSLNFNQLFSDRRVPIWMWKAPPRSCTSSTLTELKIHVETFSACLYLLDGRLPNLTRLAINAKNMSYAIGETNNRVRVIYIILFSKKKIITSKQIFIANLMFLEKTSEIEIFFIGLS